MSNSYVFDNHKVDTVISQVRQFLPDSNILLQKEATNKYGKTTFGYDRVVSAAFVLESVEQLLQVSTLCFNLQLPIYPISGGKNWGYGSAAPVCDFCVVLDLSGLKAITTVNKKLGIFKIQPGITFQDLYEYLANNNLHFYTPSIGAGPTCSVLGNILERGFGITPHADHFAMVTSFKAILPNGLLYESAHSTLGGTEIDSAYKWGVGPYLDGLFTQSSLGIVYEVTIVLRPRSDYHVLVNFGCSNEQLGNAIDILQSIVNEFGGQLSHVKIMSQRHILATFIKHPINFKAQKQVISETTVKELSKNFKINNEWQGFIAIYGTKKSTSALRDHIKKKMTRHVSQLQFFSERQLQISLNILTRFPFLQRFKFSFLIHSLKNMFEILQGKPGIASLNLAYWMNNKNKSNKNQPNPQEDECGILWFTPLVLFQSSSVNHAIMSIQAICHKYKVEPVISINQINATCLDILLPLLFLKHDINRLQEIQQCYEELFETCKRHGYLPYRMNINSMNKIINEKSGYWQLVDTIKNAIDPAHVLSPGRYSSHAQALEVIQHA